MCECTLRSLLKEGTGILEKAGIEEAGLDAWLLLEYAAGTDRAYYLAYPQETVPERQAAYYWELIQKRSRRIPLQHLTHQAFFMGYEFYVDEHVLIPRQDTEILAEEALRCLKGMEEPRILDMCTGSGCILLSLLLEKTKGRGTGADISEEALVIARENARCLGVSDRVEFVESDVFDAPFFGKTGGKDRQKYDILVSNPPYIATQEIEELMEEVRLHDPRLALDGRKDGLYFYRRITAEASDFLKAGGWLLYEIGCTQGAEVEKLMRNAGYENVTTIKDLAGLDRVVRGQKAPGQGALQEEKHV